MRQRAKATFKAMYGPMNGQIVPDYLAEFMWMQTFVGHQGPWNFQGSNFQEMVVSFSTNFICMIRYPLTLSNC